MSGYIYSFHILSSLYWNLPRIIYQDCNWNSQGNQKDSQEIDLHGYVVGEQWHIYFSPDLLMKFQFTRASFPQPLPWLFGPSRSTITTMLAQFGQIKIDFPYNI